MHVCPHLWQKMLSQTWLQEQTLKAVCVLINGGQVNKQGVLMQRVSGKQKEKVDLYVLDLEGCLHHERRRSQRKISAYICPICEKLKTVTYSIHACVWMKDFMTLNSYCLWRGRQESLGCEGNIFPSEVSFHALRGSKANKLFNLERIGNRLFYKHLATTIQIKLFWSCLYQKLCVDGSRMGEVGWGGNMHRGYKETWSDDCVAK